VLLQLPFEPVILHQWAVALMAEALRFQKKITDFTTMTYPKNLKSAVDKLTAIALLLLNGANTFLSFVAKLIIVHDETSNHMSVAASLYWEDFQQTLPQVLPALKFVLSKECDTIILALKRMAWSENAAGKTCLSKLDFKIIPSIYSHDYWDTHKMRKWLFPDPDVFEVDVPERLMIKYERVASNDQDSLKNLIEEKIIKSERLRGESEEVIFEIAAKNSDELEVFNDQYKHFDGIEIILYKVPAQALNYISLL
jgi:hypothetical protein